MRMRFVGLLVSSLIGLALGQEPSEVRAQLSVSTRMSGILIVDGRETMCGVVMLNEMYGIVAANCVTLAGTKEPNMNKAYQVVASQDGNKMFGTIEVSKFTVHPGYNAATYANNIAIAYFHTNGATFGSVVADRPNDWSELYFVHHRLASVARTAWSTPLIKIANPAEGVDSGCAANNRLYAGNNGDFLCSTLTVPWHVNPSCVAPYNVVHGALNSVSAVAAIYSHTAIPENKAFCSGTKVYNYYTILQRYISWIATTTGKSPGVLHNTGSDYVPHMDSDFTMHNPTNELIEGVNVLAGYTDEEAATGGAKAASNELGPIKANPNANNEPVEGSPELIGGRPNFPPPDTVTIMSVQISVETQVATIVQTITPSTTPTSMAPVEPQTVLVTVSPTLIPSPTAVPGPTVTITATVTMSAVHTVTAPPSTVYITLPPAINNNVVVGGNGSGQTATKEVTITAPTTVVVSATPSTSSTFAGQESLAPNVTVGAPVSKPADKNSTPFYAIIGILCALLVALLVAYFIWRKRRQNAAGYGGDDMSRVRKWWLFGGGTNGQDTYNPNAYPRSYSQLSQPMSKQPMAY